MKSILFLDVLATYEFTLQPHCTLYPSPGRHPSPRDESRVGELIFKRHKKTVSNITTNVNDGIQQNMNLSSDDHHENQWIKWLWMILAICFKNKNLSIWTSCYKLKLVRLLRQAWKVQ